MYLEKIKITNFRCFDSIGIETLNKQPSTPYTPTTQT